MRESFSRVVATLAESVAGVRVTQGFVRQDEMHACFTPGHRPFALQHRSVRTHGLFIPLLDLNSQVFIALLLFVGGYRVLTPTSSPTWATSWAFSSWPSCFSRPISVLGNQYNQALTSMAGAERLFALLDTEPEWHDPPTRTAASDSGDRRIRRCDIRLRSATTGAARHLFGGETWSDRRPGRTHRQRQDIDHQSDREILPAHRKVDCGSIGQDLRQDPDVVAASTDGDRAAAALSLSWHRRRQYSRRAAGGDGCRDPERPSAARLPGSAAGPAGRSRHARRTERCSTVGGATSVDLFLRDALLAEPRILILDEATSSIDSQTESRLQQALATMLQGRTSFVVAHRLSTIRHADQVLVLDHGRIVERGQHENCWRRRRLPAAVSPIRVEAA